MNERDENENYKKARMCNERLKIVFDGIAKIFICITVCIVVCRCIPALKPIKQSNYYCLEVHYNEN